jgi:hypothetical protein
LVTVALAAGLGACGLIDESVDDFSLSLPEKEFRVDADMWGLPNTATLPEVMCPATDCASMASTFCSSPACMVSCGTSGTCQVSTTITLYQMINMANERPELAMIDKQSGVDVTIDEISFVIEQNTFAETDEVPMLLVYAGPITAVDAMNADAEQVGTIARVPGGFMGPGQLEFIAGGKDTLERYMSEYTVPFNLIVSGMATVDGGDMIPMGMMVGKVTGKARADAI